MQSNLLHKKRLRAFSSRGQTLAEYALTLALISVVAIGVLMSMGGQVSGTYLTIGQQINTAKSGGPSAAAGSGSSSSRNN